MVHGYLYFLVRQFQVGRERLGGRVSAFQRYVFVFPTFKTRKSLEKGIELYFAEFKK